MTQRVSSQTTQPPRTPASRSTGSNEQPDLGLTTQTSAHRIEHTLARLTRRIESASVRALRGGMGPHHHGSAGTEREHPAHRARLPSAHLGLHEASGRRGQRALDVPSTAVNHGESQPSPETIPFHRLFRPWFSARSEDGEGRHQLLSRLEQPLRVLNSSLRFGMRRGLTGPSGVLEFMGRRRRIAPKGRNPSPNWARRATSTA